MTAFASVLIPILARGPIVWRVVHEPHFQAFVKIPGPLKWYDGPRNITLLYVNLAQ